MTLRRPVPADVLDAFDRLRGVAINTPILRSDELDRRTGARIFVKCENMQHSGAFKFRGAYNCLSQLDRATYPGGVVAYSTGNHGQAVATVGRMLVIATTIVMPHDAPAMKITKARKQGAEVVLYDRHRERREDIAARIASERPVAVVPPGDHPLVIAGQGTATIEALRDLKDTTVDAIVVPCGGGGLAAGTCLAIEASHSKAEVWAAEPSQFDDTRRSLLSGHRETNPRLDGSICDALLAPTPAELPFEINRERLAGVLVADDEQVMHAMRFVYEELRIIVEPGGAVALASLLSNPLALAGKTILVIASGGNVDDEMFSRALRR
ncbi:threonine/serine dehydratase [Mesorhizobium sp. M7A.F.Ca.US.006.01.1.1]|uniref:threonine ammonia-lyase n=1 Tax=Mesorhizobium sp. M7A.F.Ca.US.006.01.1.1 TaxID=2496707 RepID=UPI000FC9FA57|nr:threonine/serine dehydratase [Mesorhizobium sp. M7A.F.Ca.US.006.01.1.1]RUZ75216.1 threonine/serine dehydratase [Mesorhizobium sp. M7A.F.Ca.US.006.01.1.1]